MSAPLRTLLVDDEAPARERLTTLLKVHPQVRIVGEAADNSAAGNLCRQLRPDVLFLDVQLRGESGFDLLPRLDPVPSIIFVTAHDRYAVRAFEVNALDYLLKPVHPDRLTAALARVRSTAAAPGGALALEDLVSLREDRGLCLVPVREITHIEAEENYTRVHRANGRPAFVRRPISEWERLLPPDHFVRVVRSLIVQLGAVRGLHPESRDRVQLTLLGQPTPLPLARRAGHRLRQALDRA